MALTVRRSRLNEEATETDAETPEVMAPESPRGPVLSAVDPAPPQPSYLPYALMGLVAVILFGVLVLFQGLEIAYYNQPPSAFYAGSVQSDYSSGGSPPMAEPAAEAPAETQPPPGA
jgi:hypothetical protein